MTTIAGVSDGFYDVQPIDASAAQELFNAFAAAAAPPETEEATEAGGDDESAGPEADDDDECFVWGIGDTPAAFRSHDEAHFDCLRQFDDLRKEEDDPRNAAEFEDQVIENTEKWACNDMLMLLGKLPPTTNTTDRVIVGGLGADYAVCAIVSGETDTHGALDADAARRREASDFVASVKADARTATSLNRLQLIQSVFVARAQADPYVHAETKSVKRVVQRYKKKISERMRKEADRVRGLQEAGQADEKLGAHERVKAGVQKMLGGGGSNDPLSEHPEVKSIVAERPVGKIQVYSMTSAIATARGTKTVVVDAPPELAAQFRKVEQERHEEWFKNARRERYLAHWNDMLAAAGYADADQLDFDGEPDATQVRLAINSSQRADSIPKKSLDVLLRLRGYCEKHGIAATVADRLTLDQLVGDADSEIEVSMDAVRLAVYQARLLQAAQRIPVSDDLLDRLAQRMGYSNSAAVLLNVDALLSKAETLLQDRSVGKQWLAPQYDAIPPLDLDAYDEGDHWSFPAKLYILPVAGSKAGSNPEWQQPQNHSGSIKTTGAIATHGHEVAVGAMRTIRVYNVPTGKEITVIKLKPTWGGRIATLTMNEQFICATMDYPERELTYCTALVYHRASGEVRLLDVDPLRITTIQPDPHVDSYWIGTDKGVVYCLNWEKNEMDLRMQSLFFTATISPIKRISRVGRRIHVLTCSDLFTHDVEPLSGEMLHQMTARVGKPLQSRLEFPGAHTRYGVADFVMLRNHEVRMLLKGGASMVRVFVAPKELHQSGELEAFVRHQHIEFRAEENKLYVMYGNGRVRVSWPGPTRSQYEEPEMTRDRARLHKLLADARTPEAPKTDDTSE